jgi:hypothetical protein
MFACTYIGLDVHKETIVLALAEAGQRNEVRAYGKIANTPAAVKALVAKLARNGLALRLIIIQTQSNNSKMGAGDS